MIIIPVPKNLGFNQTLAFLDIIRAQPRDKKLVFDFENLSYISPFGLIMISAFVEILVKRCTSGSVYVKNHKHLSYQSHMGFFKAFGVDFGNAPGEAKGSGTHIPITIQNVTTIHKNAVLGGMPIGQVVHDHTNKLAKVLAHADEGDLVDTFTYSLQEIVRNVAEHSESKIVEYCAQYWPTQDRAELAILDRGIGICATLKNNPHLVIEDEQHAINLSLLPGISGKNYKGSKQKITGNWQNSGYGLYMTSCMCRSGGEFFIGSRGASVLLKEETQTHLPFNFSGTVVRMVFKPSAIGKVKETLAAYNAQGTEISKSIKGKAISASLASQMLCSHFSGKATKQNR